MKRCGHCGIEKELDAFYKDKGKKDGLCNFCKECINESKLIYNKQNRIKQNDYSRKWRAEHKPYLIGYHQIYYEANKESIGTMKNKYNMNNREKRDVIEHKRRARKRQLLATMTATQWESIKDHFNNKCVYCGQTEPLQQDHFVALSAKGEYSHNNIVPACPRCNYSKYNTNFFEWYPRQKFYSKRRESKILKFLNYKDKIQQLSFTERR